MIVFIKLYFLSARRTAASISMLIFITCNINSLWKYLYANAYLQKNTKIISFFLNNVHFFWLNFFFIYYNYNNVAVPTNEKHIRLNLSYLILFILIHCKSLSTCVCICITAFKTWLLHSHLQYLIGCLPYDSRVGVCISAIQLFFMCVFQVHLCWSYRSPFSGQVII